MAFIPPPRRCRGREILDDPAVPDDIRARAMEDLERSNALFGGTRAVLGALCDILPRLPRESVLLDVGTGLSDIPLAARELAAERGISVTALGLDGSESLLRIGRHRLQGSVAGNALRLPFASGSADVVTCSQLLHHFFDDDPATLVAELHRVSRGWVIVSELRRSRLAVAAFGIGATALRMHDVTRADGQVSILRGFTADELSRLVRDVAGISPVVRSGVFWRLTATWHKSGLAATAD